MAGRRERLQQKHPEVRHKVARHAVVRVIQQNFQDSTSPFEKQDDTFNLGLKSGRNKQQTARRGSWGLAPNVERRIFGGEYSRLIRERTISTQNRWQRRTPRARYDADGLPFFGPRYFSFTYSVYGLQPWGLRWP